MAPPPSGRQAVLRHGDEEVVAVEVGGGLRSYTAGGAPVLDGYAEDEACTGGRGQLLAPWPNRLADGRYRFAGVEHQLALTEPERRNAIHGLVRFVSWTLEVHEEGLARFSYHLRPEPGWPFALDLVNEYRLGESGLRIETRATNLGEGPSPYGCGAHPYLRTSSPTIDGLVLCAPAGVRLCADDRGIPTGEEEATEGTPYDFASPRPIGGAVLDTCYRDLARDPAGRATVSLEDPATGEGVELWMDRSYGFLMLFTGDALPDEPARRRGLAVEPMTCPPNALQSGDSLVVIEPGETFASTWGITPHRRA